MIGVLGLQGDFAAHGAALAKQNIDHKFVRLPQDLNKCSGLIIPGGESSALLKLMQPWKFLEKIREFHANGGAIFGTCAGMILLAKTITPKQESLGLIDITVERNAYGRQIESKTIFASKISPDLATDKLPITLIRAPRICKVGDGVKTLAWDGITPMLVQQNKVLAASFHPELSCESAEHNPCIINYFSKLCSN